MLDTNLAATVHRLCLNVSVDGPAGSGKTTIGKGLASALQCPYLDTGLMYRAVTLAALRGSISLDDGEALGRLGASMHFDLGGPGESLTVNGETPDPDLRSAAVDAAVPRVSAHAALRREMVRRQRELARDRCVIMVGRDIGTVVLTDAPVKLWIVASAEERARRRLAEHLPGSAGVSMEEAVRQIVARDAQDAGREISPLKRPDGAIDIDTDHLSPAESVRAALLAIQKALAEKPQTVTRRGVH